MSSDLLIEAAGVGKAYHLYRRPEDRLKQMLFGWRRRYYEEFWALREVSLGVASGHTVGIIGRNGSGKSTFLQLVCGTLTPTVGTMCVRGRVAALIELGAGFNPEFTGRENVFLAATVLGLTPAQVEERYPSIVDFAGIGDFIDQPVKTYSSGMYARLAFSVASHVDADVLIVDEILSVGDAAFNQKCMRRIADFRKGGGTLLFVSHDMAAVTNLCDTVVWLEQGSVREIGDPKTVCHNYHAAVSSEINPTATFSYGGTRRPPSDSTRASRDIRADRLREVATAPQGVEVFTFDPGAPWFGERGATITEVRLRAAHGENLAVLHGGEEVVLQIDCCAQRDIRQGIVGFYVKDRLGQQLFGDNTFLTHRHWSVSAGQVFRASFQFSMPYLPTGDYAVLAAIAEGDQENHVHHHWIDEALLFRVHTSHVQRGLIGIPMHDIRLEAGAGVVPPANNRSPSLVEEHVAKS